MSKLPKTVVILASGSGTTFQYLVENLPPKLARVSGLICSRAGIGAIQKAEILGVPYQILTEFQLLQGLDALAPDLIVLAGYLKKIPEPVVAKYGERMINVHPSLLPKFGGQGMYGQKVHAAVLSAKEKTTGATVHFVNEDFDSGHIIAQSRYEIQAGDTAESIAASVQSLEKPLLLKAVLSILEGQGTK